MITKSTAVFRNARYEARLVLCEQRITALEGLVGEMCRSLNFAIAAVESLGGALRARDEMLPGEWKPEQPARPN